MPLPTRDQLYEETDKRYWSHYPGAPSPIDPNDPAHDGWEQKWLELRDQVLYEWTDKVFYEYFPDAGRLDPSSTADEPLIRYWNDIKDQICNGTSGEWNWDSAPQATPTAPAITVEYVDRDERGGGFIVSFSAELDVDQAKAILWPNGMPSSASVEKTASILMRVRLDLEALQQMPHEIGTKFVEAGIMRAE
jgi:hypothetical protein